MMKTGVLTFHAGANFGAYLQAYCMAQAVRELGHDAEIINYKNPVHWESDRLKPWVYRRPWKLWHDYRKHQTFRRAHAQMPLSEFSSDATQVDWNRYDAIVIGSDIVWNCELQRLGTDPVYFGRFPIDYRGRLVAYAPSIGPMSPDHPVPVWVAEGLKRFHFMGVRDVNTQRFVAKQVGVSPPLVVDPTWLARETPRTAQASARRTSREFLLVYSFPLQGKAVAEIRTFARRRGLLTVGVGYYQGWCDRNWPDVDPFEWIRLFQQAKYVISGTFHGTLYAIREGAAFCLLSNEGSDRKVGTALSVVGLEDRLTSEPAAIEGLLLKPIDHDAVQLALAEQQQRSRVLLQQALA